MVLQALGFARAHVTNLPKANGDTISAQWTVANSGAIGGFALMAIGLTGQATVFGNVFAIPAGAQLPVNGFLAVAGQPLGRTVSGSVALVETDSVGNQIRVIASHAFSILTPPADELRNVAYFIRFNLLERAGADSTTWPADIGTNAQARITGEYRGNGGLVVASLIGLSGGLPFDDTRSATLTLPASAGFVPFEALTPPDGVSWFGNQFAPGSVLTFSIQLLEDLGAGSLAAIPGFPAAIHQLTLT